jgi:hypothetical protein
LAPSRRCCAAIAASPSSFLHPPSRRQGRIPARAPSSARSAGPPPGRDLHFRRHPAGRADLLRLRPLPGRRPRPPFFRQGRISCAARLCCQPPGADLARADLLPPALSAMSAASGRARQCCAQLCLPSAPGSVFHPRQCCARLPSSAVVPGSAAPGCRLPAARFCGSGSTLPSTAPCLVAICAVRRWLPLWADCPTRLSRPGPSSTRPTRAVVSCGSSGLLGFRSPVLPVFH